MPHDMNSMIREAVDHPATGVPGLLAAADVPRELWDVVLEHGRWCLELLNQNLRDNGEGRIRERLRATTDAERRAGGVLALATLSLPWAMAMSGIRYSAHGFVLDCLARRATRWTAAEAGWLLRQLVDLINAGWYSEFEDLLRLPLSAAESVPEGPRAAFGPPAQQLIPLVDKAGWSNGTSRMRALHRLRNLASGTTDAPEAIPPMVLHKGDTFGPKARTALIEAVGEPAAARVLTYLQGFGSGVTPKKSWRAGLGRLSAAGPALAVARVLLAEFLAHREAGVRERYLNEDFWEWHFVHPDTAAIVRAAVWVVATSEESWVVPLLGDVAVHAGGGLGGSGGSARCQPVASSAIAALAALAETAAGPGHWAAVVAQLSRCQAKVKNKTLGKAVAKALEAVAGAVGLTPGQLLERSVPDFGLDRDGTGEVPVGEYAALLRLRWSPTAKVDIRWRDQAGRERASVPKAVKEAHAGEVAQLRATVNELKKVITAQRVRLEDLMVADRVWPGSDWIACYAAHPVVGGYAGALIWEVGDAGTWRSGLPVHTGQGWVLRDHAGTTTPVRDDDEVRLWHPIRVPLAEVQAWRAHISEAELRQPVKQAFREIYLITPAEETTATYSNRYAAHILRYPQASALMRARGWSGNHLGRWDGGYEATSTKELSDVGWRASFRHELVEEEGDDPYSVDLCSTDRVWFERLAGGAWREATLTEVPQLVFSEVMRDVDLFVGVTSIAADPNWIDGGADRHQAYWHRTSFGDLTESAEVRREALRRLLPRTKIADRVELTDRYLVVHGQIRDYRIHLGSTNILMSPADTYLCIVPASRAKEPGRVFLPFEEDGKLAVILAKAFLLADDTAMTDPSITRQIHAGLPTPT